MGINSITGTALQGIHKGLQGMRRVASDVASVNQTQQTNPKDLSRSMVEMQQHANQVKAQVKTIKAVDQALGTLIDEKV
ncbi:MAG: hypothetical protein ABW157_17150 [Candidatus Thiodiazotropha sp. LLP2]